MKKFFVLVKKEVKELLTIQMILPLIIMVIVFGFIGQVMSKETAKIAAPQSILLLNQDTQDSLDTISGILKENNFTVSVFDKNDVSEVIKEARDKRIPVVMVIPENFSQGLKDFQPQQLSMYKVVQDFSLMASARYNMVDQAVKTINNYFSDEWLKEKVGSIKPEILKTPIAVKEFVSIDDKVANVSFSAVMGFIQKQTTFIPIVLFLVIIMAAQMVAMTVANEKENKTFEILLSSPVSRKTIIFAKLVGAGIVALLFAATYMIGFRYYMQGMTGGALSGNEADGIVSSLQALGVVVTPMGYVLLGSSLFLGVLVALAIAIILGILADSVKSVQAVTTPLMVLILLPYLLVNFTDFGGLAPFAKWMIYAIPFSHPFLAVGNLMTQDYVSIGMGIAYQAVIFLFFVVLAAKIFSSDKILTLKLNFKRKK
ncbi:MAG TPA: ABC transporter permease [Candidatus Paceibacterota bacterium]|mgnify:CR=1 FL=1|nr:ABC transporter permease [Candidatus Paceibacterota bacterium]HPT40274.1 ABC transporter permease [Candidatus Paceibacterota bacterium]